MSCGCATLHPETEKFAEAYTQHAGRGGLFLTSVDHALKPLLDKIEALQRERAELEEENDSLEFELRVLQERLE